MKLIFTLLLSCIAPFSFSQDFQITGKIVDTEGLPLGSATVYMERAIDSSLISYTISEPNGTFLLSGNTNAQEANLFISFAGYKPHRTSIQIKEQINLETIEMEIQDNELEEVIVTATRAPITIKKDTLEFNAGSFETRPDANLEDLMKKLPGVQVDSDGNITINGKPVSRILVNGEKFFGDDPLIATKNLPKEIIEKIQVTSTKTEQQEFTGEAGDNDNKTVNITIKEDKNKGYFARATIGGGTNERYEMSAIGNYFKDDLRISVLGSSNNINSSGFSYDEVFGMMGRSVGRSVFGGSGGGITKAETAGLNFVNDWDNMFDFHEVEVSADYIFERNDTERRSVVARENILPDSRYFTNSEESNNHVNDSHGANAEFEVEVDTLTRISFETSYDNNIGDSYSNRIAESLDENQNLINNSETSELEHMESENFNNEIDFTKRFGSRGAYLDLEFSNNHEERSNNNFYYSESTFFEDGTEELEIQDQFIDEDQTENSYALQARQRSVLADHFFLDVAYTFDYSNSTSERYVYEADNDGDYNRRNDLLSNNFEAISRRHTPNIGLNYEGDIWRVDTEVGLLHTNLENINYLEDGSFENTYNNLFLEAEVRYEIERSKSLSIEYETDVDIPSIGQLQPVVNRTNPLNIIVGNPELKPTYRQSIDLDYRNFNYASRTGIFSWMNVNFTDNNVVSVTTVDENLVRTTTFTNVDGAMNANIGAFYSKQKQNDISEFRYRLGLRANYNKNIGFTNGEKYTANRYGLSPSIRLTYAIDELFDINPNYRLEYNSSTYDIDPDRSEEFINHHIGLEVTTRWPENVIFGNDISYGHYGNISPGFDNTALFWNMSLGYQFLNDDANLKIKVYDLLDQNIDTRRIIGDDFIQDTSRLILTRYAMLSFTYKINNLGGNASDENTRGYN